MVRLVRLLALVRGRSQDAHAQLYSARLLRVSAHARVYVCMLRHAVRQLMPHVRCCLDEHQMKPCNVDYMYVHPLHVFDKHQMLTNLKVSDTTICARWVNPFTPETEEIY